MQEAKNELSQLYCIYFCFHLAINMQIMKLVF